MPMSPCQSSPTMADTRKNRPTKRCLPSPGDDACRRFVTSADTDENQEGEDMSPVKKMRHHSNVVTDLVNELFSPQSIHSPGPLGLNLTKSPSFLELIQKKLARAAKVKRMQATENVPSYGAMHSQSTATEGMKPSKKLQQASNFQASCLRIGDWEWKSRNQGDLVAKFYFANSKVAWEILHEGLKSKIEMKCSDICALRISCPKDLPATLDITVSVAPQFYKEAPPRPYKSTSWLHTTDFTGAQARILRRHVLQCDPGIMDKHVEKLLSGDHHLYLLSQENNINPGSPFPGTFCSVPEISLSSTHGNSYGSDDDNLFETEQTGESFPLHLMPTEKTPVGLDHSGALEGVLSPNTVVVGTSVITEETSGGSYQLQSDKPNWKKFFETTGVAQQPSMFNGGIMNGKVNHINNLVNSENSHSRSKYLSPSEVTRKFPGDSMTNRQVEPSSEEPAEPPLNKDMFSWKNFLQTPRETQPSTVSNSVIMYNESANHFNNQMNSHNLSHSADYSSLPGEMTAWRIPDDRSQPSYKHGLSNPNMIEQELPQRDSNGSQTLLRNMSSNDNISPDGMTIDQMCENLLSDDGVVNAVDDDSLLSAVNSFSGLIGQAPAPLSQSLHSHESNTLAPPPAPDVEPTQVINLDTPESSGVHELFLHGWSRRACHGHGNSHLRIWHLSSELLP